MEVVNNKNYSMIKSTTDLIGEDAKDFIREFEIEIAKHNTENYVLDLVSVKQLDSSVLAFFVSTFCVKKNKYYCLNVNSSIVDVFKMLQIDKCLKIIDSVDEIKF